jgi:hypothetical protein
LWVAPQDEWTTREIPLGPGSGQPFAHPACPSSTCTCR